jgi:hypothetical protein
MDLRIMSPTEKTKGEFKMITMKVNLLFLAMAADRDHDIPEIFLVVMAKALGYVEMTKRYLSLWSMPNILHEL